MGSGEIVGALTIWPSSYYPYKHYKKQHLSIWSVAVSKNHQRKGIGTTLMQKVMKSHKNLMLPFILVVNVKSPAKKLYEKLGFREYKLLKNAYGYNAGRSELEMDSDDEWLMVSDRHITKMSGS